MKNRRTRLSPDIPILLIIIAAVCVLKSIAVIGELDYSTGHYGSKLLIRLAGWILILGGAGLFLKGLFDVRRDKPIPSFNTPASYIPMALICLALPYLGYGLLVKRAAMIDSTPFGRAPASITALLALLAIVAFLTALSGLAFVLPGGARDHRRAICGMLIILFCSLYVIYLYLSTELPINAPNKITDEVAFSFAAVFFLYEVRISLGREVWHAYSAFGYLAALLLAYSSIPAIAVYFINGKVIANSIYESVVALTLFIFIVARLILLSELVCEEDTAYVRAMAEAHRKRINAVADIEGVDADGESDSDTRESEDIEQLMIDAVISDEKHQNGEEERNDI